MDWNAAQGRSQLRQIQAQALELAVRDTVIEQQARRRGVGIGEADLDEAVTALEGLAGGHDQLDQRLGMEGLSRGDYRALLRYTLLDRKLRAADERWDEHLAGALRAASVEAFVGPCATDHRYPGWRLDWLGLQRQGCKAPREAGCQRAAAVAHLDVAPQPLVFLGIC